MAKLPWYMKEAKDGSGFEFHPIWVLWQKVKIIIGIVNKK